jgi:3-methyl-2-oxobutanoate hydroxymethyltransferase
MREAKALEAAGAFMIVLEFVEEHLATKITEEVSVPTIGIGSGKKTNGQVLVVNDLLRLGPKMPPKFMTPIVDIFSIKKKAIEDYLKAQGK